MNGKLQESIQYLKCLNNLETETFSLYETLSKKINQPESSFILGLAYDSLKCAKTIQKILDSYDPAEIENISCKKNLLELTSTIIEYSKKIAKTNNVNYEMTCEILKQLSTLEDQLIAVYSNYIESPSMRVLSDDFSPLAINTTNFKKIFEFFKEQKHKHKETILEVIYIFEAKEADRLRKATPLVKYQNPDAWIHESAAHNFAETQVSAQQQ